MDTPIVAEGEDGETGVVDEAIAAAAEVVSTIGTNEEAAEATIKKEGVTRSKMDTEATLTASPIATTTTG